MSDIPYPIKRTQRPEHCDFSQQTAYSARGGRPVGLCAQLMQLARAAEYPGAVICGSFVNAARTLSRDCSPRRSRRGGNKKQSWEMADFDPMNIVLALLVFAAIVSPFAWWTMWQRRRNAKRRAKDEREQALQRLRAWDC